MRLEWDEEKRLANLAKHGVDFVLAESVDWEEVPLLPDRRRHYGEERWLAYATIGGRLHTIVVTFRPAAIRIISLRKANRKEIRDHG